MSLINIDGDVIKCTSCDKNAVITFPHNRENTPYCRKHFEKEKQRWDHNNSYRDYHSTAEEASKNWDRTAKIFEEISRSAKFFPF